MKLILLSHFVIGTLFLVIFLMTGGYMIINFPELYEGREEVRMMFRSTHIYILMSSLINLMAGNYLLNSSENIFLKLRGIASLLILVAPIFLFVAFVYEPPAYLIERPISFWAVVSLFSGVLLHTVLNLKQLIRNTI